MPLPLDHAYKIIWAQSHAEDGCVPILQGTSILQHKLDFLWSSVKKVRLLFGLHFFFK